MRLTDLCGLVGIVATTATIGAVARVPRRSRPGWALIATGVLIICVTGLVLGRLDLTGGELTGPLIAPGVLAYPAIIAGLLLIRRSAGLVRLSDVLDALVAALAAFLIGWIAIWHPHFRANGVLITATIAHPIGALVVFAIAVTVALSGSFGRLASVLLVVAFGALLAMTSILAVTVTSNRLGVTHNPAVPVLWAAIPVLLAGVGAVRWLPPVAQPATDPAPLTAWRVGLIIGSALLGPITWAVIVFTDPPRSAIHETAIPVLVDAVLSLLVLTRLLLTNTALQSVRSRLAELAGQDPLTGLANRTTLMTALEHSFPTSDGRRPALLLLDVDGFKQTNDTLGHPVGDAALVLIAERLASTAPPHATIARLGGDEFAIVVPDIAPEQAAELAEAVRVRLGHPYRIDRHLVSMSASIGLLSGHPGRLTRTGALRAADEALYAAKAGGRDRWIAYGA